jgi:hypothetical protein
MTPADRPLTANALRLLTTDRGPWLSCDDCFHLVDRYVDGLLAVPAPPPAGELTALPSHLAGCPACAEEATTLLLLAAADAGLDPAAMPPVFPDQPDGPVDAG